MLCEVIYFSGFKIDRKAKKYNDKCVGKFYSKSYGID